MRMGYSGAYGWLLMEKGHSGLIQHGYSLVVILSHGVVASY